MSSTNTPEKLPAIADLKTALHYDSETDEFRWISSKARSVKVGASAGNVRKGYLRIQFNGVLMFGHRIAWAMSHGEWPLDLVDHVDGNRLNNRLSNLRLATHLLNSNNTPKARGFCAVRRDGKIAYRAEIQTLGKKKHLGIFETKEEASKCYRQAKCLAIEEVLRIEAMASLSPDSARADWGNCDAKKGQS